MVHYDELRRRFVDSSADFLLENKFDGLGK
jgi:hypothetical protein